MASPLPVIAITIGEPAGIGPDLALLLALEAVNARLVFIGDANLLALRARQLSLPVTFIDYQAQDTTDPAAGLARVVHIDVVQPVVAGCLQSANAPYVLQTLRRAVSGCQQGEFDAMLTLPVHKGVINDAGIAFTGHTEFLAQQCGDVLPVMMLMTEGLRVALATTHIPLQAVAGAISRESLSAVITTVHRDLRRWFAIAEPHIVVTGLNPHAGEQGHLGEEEITIVEPVLAALRDQGMHLTGPIPADTAFIPKYMQSAHAFITMYHDQGLPVLKYLGFGKAANITLGLPIIRTSVDHGTALELAATGKVDPGSAKYALQVTLDMIAASS